MIPLLGCGVKIIIFLPYGPHKPKIYLLVITVMIRVSEHIPL